MQPEFYRTKFRKSYILLAITWIKCFPKKNQSNRGGKSGARHRAAATTAAAASRGVPPPNLPAPTPVQGTPDRLQMAYMLMLSLEHGEPGPSKPNSLQAPSTVQPILGDPHWQGTRRGTPGLSSAGAETREESGIGNATARGPATTERCCCL